MDKNKIKAVRNFCDFLQWESDVRCVKVVAEFVKSAGRIWIRKFQQSIYKLIRLHITNLHLAFAKYKIDNLIIEVLMAVGGVYRIGLFVPISVRRRRHLVSYVIVPRNHHVDGTVLSWMAPFIRSSMSSYLRSVLSIHHGMFRRHIIMEYVLMVFSTVGPSIKTCSCGNSA